MEKKKVLMNLLIWINEYKAQSHSKKNHQKSNKTLDNVKVFNRADLEQEIASIASKHISQKNQIHVNTKMQFSDWITELLSGYSILLYGFGSKQKILTEFSQCIPFKSLVVDGYSPNSSIKNVKKKKRKIQINILLIRNSTSRFSMSFANNFWAPHYLSKQQPNN